MLCLCYLQYRKSHSFMSNWKHFVWIFIGKTDTHPILAPIFWGKKNILSNISMLVMLHPGKIWWQSFQWGSGWLSSILKKFIDLYCFSHFQPLLFSCIRCSFVRTQFYQAITIFFFSSSFLGTFFGVPIMFECYRF